MSPPANTFVKREDNSAVDRSEGCAAVNGNPAMHICSRSFCETTKEFPKNPSAEIAAHVGRQGSPAERIDPR